MHLPGTKKSEKRKASVVSVEDSEKKEGKREKKKKKKAKSNQRRGEKKAERPTPDPQLQVSSPRSLTTPTAMSPDDRVDSVTESYAPTPFSHPSYLLMNSQSFIYNPHSRAYRPYPAPQLAHQKLPAQCRADMGQGAAVH